MEKLLPQQHGNDPRVDLAAPAASAAVARIVRLRGRIVKWGRPAENED